jgi:hypothetical protein
LREKFLKKEYDLMEKKMKDILPYLNEANLTAKDLQRKVEFKSRIIKKPIPGQDKLTKPEVIIRVDNKEDDTFY